MWRKWTRTHANGCFFLHSISRFSQKHTEISVKQPFLGNRLSFFARFLLLLLLLFRLLDIHTICAMFKRETYHFIKNRHGRTRKNIRKNVYRMHVHPLFWFASSCTLSPGTENAATIINIEINTTDLFAWFTTLFVCLCLCGWICVDECNVLESKL